MALMKSLMKTMKTKKRQGFSLLELMVVLSIIAILAMVVVPSYVSATAKEQVRESLDIVEKLKARVELLYQHANAMPASNEAAGLPAADKLLGNYVASIELENGAFHILFGSKAVTPLQGKILTVRAITVVDSPASPLSWVCGNSIVPRGMEARGENRTSVPAAMLPVSCRAIRPADGH